MLLKITVVLAAIAQVVGAAFLSIGTFEQSERILPVFIQPSSWAFSIWGLIYTLSFVYAGYQLFAKKDTKLLQRTRISAITAFLGSLLWLYFAGQEGPLVWLTAVVLFVIALALTRVVTAPDSKDNIKNFLSKSTLLPYAAWTGIACWLNVQVLLVEEEVLMNSASNAALNAFLFVAVAAYGLYFFKKSKYSIWYGGVLVWASVGVITANQLSDGGILFSIAAGALTLIVTGLYIKSWSK